MAGKMQQKSTFGVRLPDFGTGTSLPELRVLVDAMCTAMAAMAACSAEELRVAKIRMNSPLEVQFESDHKTVLLVKDRIDRLSAAHPVKASPFHSSRSMVDQPYSKLAEELGKLAKKANGSVELRSGSGKWHCLSRRQLKNIAQRRSRQELLKSYRTSLTGVLEQVTVEGEKQRFRIRESATGRNIQCDFPGDMLKRVKDALPHRVCVSGTVSCPSGDEVDSMEAEDFEILPDRNDIPLTQLQPLNITGGRDAAELIARLRDGE